MTDIQKMIRFRPCYIESFQMSDHLHNLLKEENMTLLTSETFFDNPRNQIENIKVRDFRLNPAPGIYCTGI